MLFLHAVTCLSLWVQFSYHNNQGFRGWYVGLDRFPSGKSKHLTGHIYSGCSTCVLHHGMTQCTISHAERLCVVLPCMLSFFFFGNGTEHLRNTKSTVFFLISAVEIIFHRAHICMFLHVWLAALLMFNSGEKMVFLACRGVPQSDIVENERMLPASGLWRWNLHEINKIEWMLSNSLPLDCECPGVIEGPASLHLVFPFIQIVWLKRSDTNNLQWPVYNCQWINCFTLLHLFYTFSETKSLL